MRPAGHAKLDSGDSGLLGSSSCGTTHVNMGLTQQRRPPAGHGLPLPGGAGGGGGMAAWAAPPDPPTHPNHKILPQKKTEIYQRGPTLEVDFRDTNFFFLASDPSPPPPVYVTVATTPRPELGMLEFTDQGYPLSADAMSQSPLPSSVQGQYGWCHRPLPPNPGYRKKGDQVVATEPAFLGLFQQFQVHTNVLLKKKHSCSNFLQRDALLPPPQPQRVF